tara:strand:- start:434 stop:865 length:432 start_codon:yes stop_codon:yes gene_type:complete
MRMSCLADPRIEALQQQADASGELSFPIGADCFRINLRDENIQLWLETFEQITSPANLLLACADNAGDLIDTKLTWVVGSAIRGTTVESPTDAKELLQAMGSSHELAQNALEYCPGLGGNLVWAFYLERHGGLIATPITCLES